MKLPAAVQVGPHCYSVSVSEAGRGLIGANYGQTDHRQLRITLHPDQAPSQLRDTLLHEVLHCLVAQASLDQMLDLTQADDQESLVRRLSPALLDVLRRNPKLVAYLS